MVTPFRIFVSHIHEEAELAAAVKNGVEDAFRGHLRVFVSSDIRDNPGGKEWAAKLKSELKDPRLRLLVTLASQRSVVEPWISTEMGAAWILGRDIFPLCHSGLQPGALPRPMSDFGGTDLGADDSASRLIRAVEEATGLLASQWWPRERFLAELRRAAHQVVT
jgi:hypothetical protein